MLQYDFMPDCRYHLHYYENFNKRHIYIIAPQTVGSKYLGKP